LKGIEKFIIDTNVIFSALYKPISNAGLLIDLVLEGKIELYAPEKVRGKLIKNLKEKLAMNENEVEAIFQGLPIKWFDRKLYDNFMKKTQEIISDKDAQILAAHFLTKYPIITGDKKFFNIKSIKVYSLREVIDKFIN